MITSTGKVLQIHGKRFCRKCGEITAQTCFYMKYRKHPRNDDAYEKTEKWICDRCVTETVVVKEIPEPTEKSMLVKLLMSLGEKYELAGSTIEVRVNEVRATFRFPEHNLPKLREIAYNWAERGYITAKHLLMLERAGMADVSQIPPRWAPSKREARREAMRRVFED
jgi:hypothetical protein